jgi:NADPH:quinone reductase-like Zn-dependent oxidoreductase
MKAIHHDRFGPPNILELADLGVPSPGPGQVLVEIRAAGVNPGDRHAIRGVPYAARLMGYGLRRPKQPVPGMDLAGTVAALGQGVGRFAIGDAVFGWGTGTFAEFAVAAEDRIEPKPDRLTFEQAAAIPTAATAALQALRDVGRTRVGSRVVIIGASGGVGTFAVQIANAIGAEVTGVASTRNLELVRSAGAHRTIDYTVDDITDRAERFDVVVDLVGRLPLRHGSRLLAPGGTYVVVGGQNPDSITGMGRFVSALALSPLLRRRLRPLFSQPDHADLAELRRLVDEGLVLPVIDAVHDLPGTADALRYVEAGHSRGKVVITT